MVRGIRNNNPGNIRHSSSKWLGLSPSQLDKEFCTFSEMKYGCRALMILLQNYSTKYNCNTVEKIINKYAPSCENNSEAYIDSVCKQTGFLPNESLDLTQKDILTKLAKAITRHECGKEAESITDTTWNQALELVFK